MGVFDVGVGLAFWLTLASTALCVGYGLWRWNKDGSEMQEVSTQKWDDEEDLINKGL
jgi:hypothetical protein